MKKISVIGAGNVGATLVQRIAEAELAEQVAVVDIVEGVPQGKALDILQSGPVYGYDTRVIGSNEYDVIEGSDIVVITAGVARKPGMSRDDLLSINAKVVGDVAKQIKANAPNSIVMVVSNPLDVMCHVALEASGFPKNRVFGMAGVLDTARYKTFLAEALQCSVEDIQAFVLGGHGDTMVPLPRYTSVAGIPLPQLMDAETIERIVNRTRNGGAEIVGYLKTGSAYYAPSASVIPMIESIVKNKQRILPCSVYLQGEYGLKDLYVGVPVKLGAQGVEQIIEIELTADEREALHTSAGTVRSALDSLKTLAVS